jgi:hypothetical protein
MTAAERFRRALEVVDAEIIADAARADGFSDGQARLVERDVLLYSGMVAILRLRLGLSDLNIAKVVIDLEGFADEVLEDSQHPERRDSGGV